MAYIYNLTDTWNAAGTAFNGIKMVVTNTASAAGSYLINLSSTGATTGSFTVDKSGNGAVSGTFTVTGAGSIQGMTVGLGGGASSTNVAFGNVALASNTTGTFNVAIGSSALAANLVGNNNLAIGSSTLSVNTGSTNTAIGTASLTANTTGVQNVGVGYATLATNSVGNNNTAVGTNALITCTGSGNAAVGYNAGNKIAGGGNNTTVGNSAGYSITSGINNACLGQASGYGITTGSYNVIIGGYQGSAAPISATGSNYVVLSDGAANIGAYWQNGGGWYQQNNNASWSVTSDVSIKTNIIDLEGGLSVINALRAVEFDYIDSGRHDEGFIAQEYINVLPRQVAKKEDGKLAIQFNLLPYLVKAIQELSSENADLKQRLTALEGK
jgi:hypothetical protein